MSVLLALVALALLAGLFYGFGTSRAPALPEAETGAETGAETEARAALPDAATLPGGDPSRAILVDSPVVIESQAERDPCPVCGGSVRCEQHRAEQILRRRVRVAHIRCPRCGFSRDVYFALRSSDPH